MNLLQDVRFAIRLLIKDKWFTLIAAVALALGIGANATVFTFVNAVLIRSLPIADPDQVVQVSTMDAKGRRQAFSMMDFRDLRESAHGFSELALYSGATANVSDEGRPAERFQGLYTTANLFRLIKQPPMLGRDFRPEDEKIGADPVVMLGYSIWKNRYGSDPSIVGRSIKINSGLFTVIGVMPADMQFPNNNDLWMPMAQAPPELRDSKRSVRSFQLLGRLAPGTTLQQSRSEVGAIMTRLAHDFPDSNKETASAIDRLSDRVNPTQIRLVFLTLMGAVGFVLLIACANVANLLLARSAARAREICVRVSLGASRWRIVRQLLVESVLLAVFSGVLGYALSIFGVRWFDSATQNVGKPYWIHFTMDGTVFAFIAAVCLGTGLLFGLAPALHVSKTDVNEVLKEAAGRSGSGGKRARRWTGALIVVELALTLVLLAGSGFMLRSFFALYRQDLGSIDTSRLLTMRLALPLARYPQRDTRTLLYQRIEERLRGVNAVQAAAITTMLPTQGGFERQLTVEGRPPAAGTAPPTVTMVEISNGYFDTLHVPVVRGRAFLEGDGTPGHEAAIVNQRFVAMHFRGEDPIGQRITLVDSQPGSIDPAVPSLPAAIVGVVPSIRQAGRNDPEPDPVVFLPYRVDSQRFAVLLVRGTGDPTSLTSVVRDEMRALEPDLPLFDIRTLDDSLAQQRWPFRIFGTLFTVFAIIALMLSAVGLYAVTAYSVSQRTQELGVRMALGALPTQVLWLVLRRGLIQLAIGLPLGVAGAFGVGKLLESLLVQTTARDPLTIVSITVLLVIVSIVACIWPARRATRLDPVSALRYE